MATLKVYHSVTKANPGLLEKIQAYFDSMFIFDEQDEYTIYQVEKKEKIGDIPISIDFRINDFGTIVCGHRPA